MASVPALVLVAVTHNHRIGQKWWTGLRKITVGKYSGSWSMEYVDGYKIRHANATSFQATIYSLLVLRMGFSLGLALSTSHTTYVERHYLVMGRFRKACFEIWAWWMTTLVIVPCNNGRKIRQPRSSRRSPSLPSDENLQLLLSGCRPAPPRSYHLGVVDLATAVSAAWNVLTSLAELCVRWDGCMSHDVWWFDIIIIVERGPCVHQTVNSIRVLVLFLEEETRRKWPPLSLTPAAWERVWRIQGEVCPKNSSIICTPSFFFRRETTRQTCGIQTRLDNGRSAAGSLGTRNYMMTNANHSRFSVKPSQLPVCLVCTL